MGKRKKSSRKPGPKRKREPLGRMNPSFSTSHSHGWFVDTTFTCLFCHHDNSVMVKLDRKEGVAQLVCKVCGQSFQSKVNRTFFTRDML
jgi:transcription elongation factor Elf1